MSIEFDDNILSKTPKDLNDKTGVFDGTSWRPYNNLTEALSSPKLIAGYRSLGLTIYVLRAGQLTEYWWRDGLADNQLIVKDNDGSAKQNISEKNQPNGYAGLDDDGNCQPPEKLTVDLLLNGRKTGNIIYNNYEDSSGISFHTKITTEWADGSAMDDSKVDNQIYFKNKPELGGGYSILALDLSESRTLTLDGIVDLRGLSKRNIILIKLGYYNKVETKGYFNIGDGGGVQYKVNFTSTGYDDGFMNIGTTLNILNIGFIPILPDQVNVRIAGARGNNDTDDTLPIQRVLNVAKYVIIKDGTYIINPIKKDGAYELLGGVQATSNQTIEFINAKLTIKPQSEGAYVILNLRNTNNVTILNAIIEGDVHSHLGETGETGYGCYLGSASNFKILNSTFDKCWGDGIMVSGDQRTTGLPCLNGVIENCSCGFNRRQGISIESWLGGKLINHYAHNTGRDKGTAPSFGIDIEPKPGVHNPNDQVDIDLINVKTENNLRGGLQFVPGFLTNPETSNRNYKVRVSNFVSIKDGNLGGVRFAYPELSSSYLDLNKSINGGVYFDGIYIDTPFNSGFRVDRYPNGAPKIIGKNLTVIDANEQAITNLEFSSAISITNGVGQTVSTAPIYIDGIFITDNRVTPRMRYPVYYASITGVGINNLNLNNIRMGTWDNDTFPNRVFLNRSGTNFSITHDGIPITTLNEATIVNNNLYNGETLRLNGAFTVSLPSASNFANQVLTFISAGNGNSVISPSSGQAIRFFGCTVNTAILLRSLGDTIKIRSSGSGWDVIYYTGKIHASGRTSADINNSYMAKAGTPAINGDIPLWPGDYYFDTGKNVWYKAKNNVTSNDYVQLNATTASESNEGLVQIATRAEVTAGAHALRVVTPANLHLSGTTASRPTGTLKVGLSYFDTTLGKPIWWKGAVWVDVNGTTV